MPGRLTADKGGYPSPEVPSHNLPSICHRGLRLQPDADAAQPRRGRNHTTQASIRDETTTRRIRVCTAIQRLASPGFVLYRGRDQAPMVRFANAAMNVRGRWRKKRKRQAQTSGTRGNARQSSESDEWVHERETASPWEVASACDGACGGRTSVRSVVVAEHAEPRHVVRVLVGDKHAPHTTMSPPSSGATSALSSRRGDSQSRRGSMRLGPSRRPGYPFEPLARTCR